MKSVIFAAGAAFLLCSIPAHAQQSTAAKSPFCEKFDHKSPAVINKTMVIQLPRAADGTAAEKELETT
ncbi:MAG TPA: hypothetical protein VFO36_06480, partial [Nitrospiraceae bacterium]|nr:hypothetical protein [Nitrospiraceae bacterium]